MCRRHVRVRLRALIVGSIVAVTVLATGCGGTSGSSPSKTTPAGQTGGVTVEQGVGGALVFSPTTLTVAKGTTITVKNVDSKAHTFTITGKGIDVVNEPGQSQQVTINLSPGTYEFICRFHVSSGMKGTLVVQ